MWSFLAFRSRAFSFAFQDLCRFFEFCMTQTVFQAPLFLSRMKTVIPSHIPLFRAVLIIFESRPSPQIILLSVGICHMAESPVPLFLFESQLDQLFQNVECIFSPSSVENQIQAKYIVIVDSVNQRCEWLSWTSGIVTPRPLLLP